MPSKSKGRRRGPPATWKGVEQEVASMFDTTRNPLSGSNNVSDSGDRRIGDIVGDIIVEVKYRKEITTLKRALETKLQAEEWNKTHKKKRYWIHVERQHGDKDLWVLVVNKHLFSQICLLIKSLSEKGHPEDAQEN